MLEECSDLGGSDLEVRARGRVTVDSGRVSTWCAKTVSLPNYVQACLARTHSAGVCSMAVHEGLAIVIVFLLAEAEGGECDAVW